MTYFQNIHSLADLKKEYRRLALEHHPDKGGDTAIMQQVTTELEGFLRLGKKNRIFPRPQPDMNMTIREPRQRNTPGMCITNTAGKAAITRGSTLRKSWDWYGHGSRRPIRDTSSLPDGRITTPSISG